mmetsp:Transcript_19808/g.55707  ORF Transcript_19808/g.55707 Transcript_19808/m.55707 type:complete len:238 (+) Transcript_19808:161-874(+)
MGHPERRAPQRRQAHLHEREGEVLRAARAHIRAQALRRQADFLRRAGPLHQADIDLRLQEQDVQPPDGRLQRVEPERADPGVAEAVQGDREEAHAVPARLPHAAAGGVGARLGRRQERGDPHGQELQARPAVRGAQGRVQRADGGAQLRLPNGGREEEPLGQPVRPLHQGGPGAEDAGADRAGLQRGLRAAGLPPHQEGHHQLAPAEAAPGSSGQPRLPLPRPVQGPEGHRGARQAR